MLPAPSFIIQKLIMCGRTCLSLHKNQVRSACCYKPRDATCFVEPDWLPEHNDGKNYEPSSNIAPTDVTPILISSYKFKNVCTTSRVLKPMMWGIVPPWHQGDYKTHNLSTNNCRLENIRTSKLYNPILENGGRCVIVIEGFYEWQTTVQHAQVKQPYYIYSPQREGTLVYDSDTWSNTYNEESGWQGVKLLHMAGLYYAWKDKGTVVYSYSVITMDSNSTMNWLHHRMPAVLDTQTQIEAWLDVENVNVNMALEHLKTTNKLFWHPVCTAVNNSRNKSKDCNKKKEQKKQSQQSITSWFTKTNKRKQSDDTNSDLKTLKK